MGFAVTSGWHKMTVKAARHPRGSSATKAVWMANTSLPVLAFDEIGRGLQFGPIHAKCVFSLSTFFTHCYQEILDTGEV